MSNAEDKVLELYALERRAKIPELAVGQWHAQLLEEHGAGDLLGLGNEALGRIVRKVRGMSPEQFRNWIEFQSSQDEEIETYIDSCSSVEPQDEPGQPLGLFVARSPNRRGLL